MPSEPALSEVGPRDASALATLHAAAFRRGWSEDELEQLLIDKNVVAHRVMLGRTLAGFIISRRAAGEAEILSVAVASARRASKAGAGRLVGRLRGCGGGPGLCRRDRDGHRRFDPPAGRFLRDCRAQADLWPLLALGDRRIRILA